MHCKLRTPMNDNCQRPETTSQHVIEKHLDPRCLTLVVLEHRGYSLTLGKILVEQSILGLSLRISFCRLKHSPTCTNYGQTMEQHWSLQELDIQDMSRLRNGSKCGGKALAFYLLEALALPLIKCSEAVEPPHETQQPCRLFFAG